MAQSRKKTAKGGEASLRRPRPQRVVPVARNAVRDAIIARMTDLNIPNTNALWDRVKDNKSGNVRLVRSHVYAFLNGQKDMSTAPLMILLDDLGLVIVPENRVR